MIIHLKKIHVKDVLLEIWHRKEAVIWITALMALAFSDPTDHHYTLCPFHNLGWHFCPGCGIGRSISFLFQLNIKESLTAHPFGIPAVLIIVHRIYKVLTKPMSINN